MKQSHFKYYWEQINQNVIVANVRTNIATRVNRDNKKSPTGYKPDDWAKMSRGPFQSIDRIARSKARQWFKSNIVPVNA